MPKQVNTTVRYEIYKINHITNEMRYLCPAVQEQIPLAIARQHKFLRMFKVTTLTTKEVVPHPKVAKDSTEH